MADANISELLNEVWAAFRRIGISEDLRIIEHVAAFLLEQEGISLNATLPRRLSPVSGFDEAEVADWLKSASEKAGAAVLFDRHVLFRLPAMLKGGRYPTPRHIAQMMIHLVETEGNLIADFACGSGGLLVNSAGRDLTGSEISPEWTRLARANALLHHKQADIREGNALSAIRGEELFDCILMNPPFGETVRSDYGTRSETALNALALAHLSEDGRAALLAPGGLLFSGSKKDRNFRVKAVDDYHVEAVVTLPDDAFQPYSTLRTHLLLVHKVSPSANTLTWFLRPVFDGYISGRGRNLTRDPQTPNDLTLVEAAIFAGRQNNEAADGIPFTSQLLRRNEPVGGVFLRPNTGAILVNVHCLPARLTRDGEEPAILVLQVQREGVQQFWRCSTDAESVAQLLEKPDELIRERYGLTKSEPIPPALFQNQSSPSGQDLTSENAVVRGVVVKSLPNQPAQLIGVAVSRNTLHQFDYSLEPDRYLREPEVRAEKRLPHDILRDIRNRQQELAERMTQLAGWLVPERSQKASILSPVLEAEPFGRLNDAQQRIWEIVVGKISPIPSIVDRFCGNHFTVDEILERSGDAGEDTVNLALRTHGSVI